MSKLIDIEGIGPEERDLLEAAGWAEPRAIATADLADLSAELEKANRILKIAAVTPDRATVAEWIRKAAASLGEEVVIPPVDEEPVEVDEAAEEALAVVSGPVNFEADRDIAAMLDKAPFALPIPARLLAGQGIPPAEVPVAPLLNRAMGDLDVRVDADAVKRPIPALREAKPRPAPAVVKAAEPVVTGRRGIDTAKVRTLEEAQSAPPVKAPSSQAAVANDRVSLIRAPLPETNARRKPSSRFYIRGVLHDRPFRVWFGGFFAVLLQLLLPLAFIAAPLLILSQQSEANFGWVPKWIIAFPMALPFAGLLYLFCSVGAKCRVCGQRLYVPKHCLKNSKAHHLPLIGHIGALALHVMVFRWFKCTFCGTAIRIKK